MNSTRQYIVGFVLIAFLLSNNHLIHSTSASEARLYFKLGKKYNNSCQYTQALPMLERACQLEPDTLHYYLALWQVYAFQNRWEEALKVLEKSPIDPKKISDHYITYLNYYWACGYTYQQLGQADRAQQFFNKILTFKTVDHYRYWWLKGNAFSMLTKRTQAIECWKRAIEKAGNEKPEECAILYHNIGQACMLDNDYDTAIISLTKSIKRNSKRSPTHYLLGTAYHKRGHADISSYYYKKATELDPIWTHDINNSCICY